MNDGLSVRDVYKSFGKKQALAGVSFDLPEGQVMAMLGPSGSGKSTLLGIIAGLDSPDQGEVLWKGESLRGVPPHRRGFGLMFQDFALFPHRNVFDNVAFALQMASRPKAEIERRVAEMLELVGLPGFEQRDVNTLSGGEQQRVALARSLAPNPRLLMLDEPLGALDRNLRERLALDLGHILHEMHQTALYVTHDQEEAFTLADQVVILNEGRIEQTGAPQEIYLRPRSLFVARFLGMSNLVSGEVFQRDGRLVAATALGELPLPPTSSRQVTVLVRPDRASLDGQGDLQLDGEVIEKQFRGSLSRTRVRVGGVELLFDFPSHIPLPAPGQRVQISLNTDEALQVFEK